MSETDWRARKKASTRRAIKDHALRLILAKGFEATTVEEIAAAAGVSHMTFFRHFPRKENVVEIDDYDALMGAQLAARPVDEPPLTAVHRAVRGAVMQIPPADQATILVRATLVLRTPALRDRNHLNLQAGTANFAAWLASRAGQAEPDLATKVLAGAAVAALSSAMTAWVEREGAVGLELLLDEAFGALGVPPVTAATG
ncbi:TetR/AcrR family transcriptional regulator [Crossiella sp. CA198]|uniref:TetR/AcrR family transcriptional regulator n=1 Tax=Crossiella sp. CA198 TaxID=3455607 RepID=UPI003F8D859C